ncbi:hypothetical protein [Halococcus sediminicola]|uniref:hypothetical protein n=1 Tax=Halococcus sediminicola TaxID=1264579 RepID=UPI0012AB3BD9|nr:hypothetical protein [Halococcus sediminicola]
MDTVLQMTSADVVGWTFAFLVLGGVSAVLWVLEVMSPSRHEQEMSNIRRKAEKQALREELGLNESPKPEPKPQTTTSSSLDDVAKNIEPDEPEPVEPEPEPEIGDDVDIGVNESQYQQKMEKNEFTHDDADSRTETDGTSPPEMNAISEIVESVDTDLEET